MNPLAALYPPEVVSRNVERRNKGALPGETHRGRAVNALCGDAVIFMLRVAAGRVEDARFQGEGCAVCIAAADMLADTLRDRALDALEPFAAAAESALAGKGDASRLGELAPLAGVSAFPSRIPCAVLPLRALRDAVKNLHG